MADRDSSRQSTGSEVRDALADVMEHVHEREERGRPPRPPESTGVVAAVATAILAAVAVWFWVSPPSFVMPDPLPQPTAQELEDGLRMEMWTVAGRVEAYRERTGRLPETLDAVREAPDEFEDVSYESGRRGGFTLTGVVDSVSVTWSSAEGEDALLGDAPLRIRLRGER